MSAKRACTGGKFILRERHDVSRAMFVHATLAYQFRGFPKNINNANFTRHKISLFTVVMTFSITCS